MTSIEYGDVYISIHLDMRGRIHDAPGWYLTEMHNEGYSSVLGDVPAKKWITPQQAQRIAEILAEETNTPQLLKAVTLANTYAKNRIVQLKATADEAAARSARLAEQVQEWDPIS